MTAASNASSKAWEQIESEKRRDRLIQRICVGAWIVTVLILLGTAVLFGLQAKELFGGVARGEVPLMTIVGMLLPFISMLWVMSLLVAALSTIGVFLRFRSASLAEIQLRLASLEEMIVTRDTQS